MEVNEVEIRKLEFQGSKQESPCTRSPTNWKRRRCNARGVCLSSGTDRNLIVEAHMWVEWRWLKSICGTLSRHLQIHSATVVLILFSCVEKLCQINITENLRCATLQAGQNNYDGKHWSVSSKLLRKIGQFTTRILLFTGPANINIYFTVSEVMLGNHIQ